MRCYFLKNGHIGAVEVLEPGLSDTDAIKKGSTLFLKRLRDGYDGFEVWDRERVVFRYPEDEGSSPDSNSGTGIASSRSKPRNGGRKSAELGL
jgi:hypothetical protein